jgi:hypothetical protein
VVGITGACFWRIITIFLYDVQEYFVLTVESFISILIFYLLSYYVLQLDLCSGLRWLVVGKVFGVDTHFEIYEILTAFYKGYDF